MEPEQIAVIGYVAALIAFALLTVVLSGRSTSNRESRFLTMASGASVIWAAATAVQTGRSEATTLLNFAAESLRYLAWLIALVSILRRMDPTRVVERKLWRYGGISLLPLVGLLSVYHVWWSTETPVQVTTESIGFLSCVLILIAIEQINRNAPAGFRSGLNYFCLAVAGIFIYDLLLLVSALAGVPIPREYSDARGFANAIFVLPLGVGILRVLHLTSDVQVPRQIVFYTFGFIAIGIYAALIVIGNYYITVYGGSWSQVASIVFSISAIAAIVVLLASATIRARVRVLLMKTFLRYKYDYRREWLRFIATLSESGMEKVSTTAVRAIAQIVNSPGGIVWVQEQEGEAYVPIGSWNSDVPTMAPIDGDSSLVHFLANRQWVIDLREMELHPARYENLSLPGWFLQHKDWWLIVPLSLGKRLFGFVILKKPRIAPSLNFEDHDLLRTVGRHVGMHINQAESDKRLAESSQFGTYNRLTAFLMHDLNNLIAQQSLVVSNAERFRDNPKFVDDAIDTIANSVSRMKRLMEQLSSGTSIPQRRKTDVRDALTRAVKRCELRQPVPVLKIGDKPIEVLADSERLTTVFEHLIRNAQDATGREGRIFVEAITEGSEAYVSIRDTGCGMSPEFIRDRLFRPFDSTKGSQSMGIGAYQARDYVRALGGQVEVSSEQGVGTTFTVRLPLVG